MGRWKAACASIDVTPAPGGAMTGYIAREGPSEGVLDPLFLRGLLLDDGARRFLLLAYDCLALPLEWIGEARIRMSKKFDLEPKAVWITATHTHSGPATVFLRECGEVDTDYLAGLKKATDELAGRLSAELRPARLGSGTGRLRIGYNRRAATPEGVRIGENFYGAYDEALAVLRVDEADGRVRHLVINHGCHPTVLGPANRNISPDWPGYASAAAARLAGDGLTAMVVNGACGDVNPEGHGTTVAKAKELGERVARAALKTAGAITTMEEGTLAFATDSVDAPLAFPEAEAVPAGAGAAGKPGARSFTQPVGVVVSPAVRARIARAHAAWREGVDAYIASGKKPGAMRIRADAARIGDSVWIGLAGEPFAEIGTSIRAASRAPATFVLGYVGGDVGYFPTRAGFAAGGYEAAEAYKFYGLFPFAPGIGERLAEAAGRLAGQLMI